ncbi:hypothetical protein DMB90_02360 [Raoultella planticola]|uniref:Uncharacterized protein n=1 Tax=Raoultella planticola TaxID=575 RepID=A0A5P6A942_RAOPL|nr:hypothetical protein DMB90_02360 [Raoultella planticola]
MRWQGRRESDNVEDRRNDSGSPWAAAVVSVFPAGRAVSSC